MEGYKDELKPVFQSTPTQFQTIIYANVEEKIDGKDGVKDVGNIGDVAEMKLSVRQIVILQIVLADSKVSAKAISEKISEKTSITARTIENDFAQLKKLGVLAREGGRKDGEWLLTELGLATLEKLKK